VLVAAPKKQFKQATVRNRVKRLLRESWRLERGDLPMQWLEAGTPKIIGLIYTGGANPTLVGMRASLRGLLDKAKW
jgi:ribonuclease P protein component